MAGIPKAEVLKVCVALDVLSQVFQQLIKDPELRIKNLLTLGQMETISDGVETATRLIKTKTSGGGADD